MQICQSVLEVESQRRKTFAKEMQLSQSLRNWSLRHACQGGAERRLVGEHVLS